MKLRTRPRQAVQDDAELLRDSSAGERSRRHQRRSSNNCHTECGAGAAGAASKAARAPTDGLPLPALHDELQRPKRRCSPGAFQLLAVPPEAASTRRVKRRRSPSSGGAARFHSSDTRAGAPRMTRSAATASKEVANGQAGQSAERQPRRKIGPAPLPTFKAIEQFPSERSGHRFLEAATVPVVAARRVTQLAAGSTAAAGGRSTSQRRSETATREGLGIAASLLPRSRQRGIRSTTASGQKSSQAVRSKTAGTRQPPPARRAETRPSAGTPAATVDAAPGDTKQMPQDRPPAPPAVPPVNPAVHVAAAVAATGVLAAAGPVPAGPAGAAGPSLAPMAPTCLPFADCVPPAQDQPPAQVAAAPNFAGARVSPPPPPPPSAQLATGPKDASTLTHQPHSVSAAAASVALPAAAFKAATPAVSPPAYLTSVPANPCAGVSFVVASESRQIGSAAGCSRLPPVTYRPQLVRRPVAKAKKEPPQALPPAGLRPAPGAPAACPVTHSATAASAGARLTAPVAQRGPASSPPQAAAAVSASAAAVASAPPAVPLPSASRENDDDWDMGEGFSDEDLGDAWCALLEDEDQLFLANPDEPQAGPRLDDLPLASGHLAEARQCASRLLASEALIVWIRDASDDAMKHYVLGSVPRSTQVRAAAVAAPLPVPVPAPAPTPAAPANAPATTPARTQVAAQVAAASETAPVVALAAASAAAPVTVQTAPRSGAISSAHVACSPTVLGTPVNTSPPRAPTPAHLGAVVAAAGAPQSLALASLPARGPGPPGPLQTAAVPPRAAAAPSGVSAPRPPGAPVTGAMPIAGAQAPPVSASASPAGLAKPARPPRKAAEKGPALALFRGTGAGPARWLLRDRSFTCYHFRWVGGAEMLAPVTGAEAPLLSPVDKLPRPPPLPPPPPAPPALVPPPGPAPAPALRPASAAAAPMRSQQQPQPLYNPQRPALFFGPQQPKPPPLLLPQPLPRPPAGQVISQQPSMVPGARPTPTGLSAPLPILARPATAAAPAPHRPTTPSGRPQSAAGVQGSAPLAPASATVPAVTGGVGGVSGQQLREQPRQASPAPPVSSATQRVGCWPQAASAEVALGTPAGVSAPSAHTPIRSPGGAGVAPGAAWVPTAAPPGVPRAPASVQPHFRPISMVNKAPVGGATTAATPSTMAGKAMAGTLLPVRPAAEEPPAKVQRVGDPRQPASAPLALGLRIAGAAVAGGQIPSRSAPLMGTVPAVAPRAGLRAVGAAPAMAALQVQQQRALQVTSCRPALVAVTPPPQGHPVGSAATPAERLAGAHTGVKTGAPMRSPGAGMALLHPAPAAWLTPALPPGVNVRPPQSAVPQACGPGFAGTAAAARPPTLPQQRPPLAAFSAGSRMGPQAAPQYAVPGTLLAPFAAASPVARSPPPLAPSAPPPPPPTPRSRPYLPLLQPPPGAHAGLLGHGSPLCRALDGSDVQLGILVKKGLGGTYEMKRAIVAATAAVAAAAARVASAAGPIEAAQAAAALSAATAARNALPKPSSLCARVELFLSEELFYRISAEDRLRLTAVAHEMERGLQVAFAEWNADAWRVAQEAGYLALPLCSVASRDNFSAHLFARGTEVESRGRLLKRIDWFFRPGAAPDSYYSATSQEGLRPGSRHLGGGSAAAPAHPPAAAAAAAAAAIAGDAAAVVAVPAGAVAVLLNASHAAAPPKLTNDDTDCEQPDGWPFERPPPIPTDDAACSERRQHMSEAQLRTLRERQKAAVAPGVAATVGIPHASAAVVLSAPTAVVSALGGGARTTDGVVRVCTDTASASTAAAQGPQAQQRSSLSTDTMPTPFSGAETQPWAAAAKRPLWDPPAVVREAAAAAAPSAHGGSVALCGNAAASPVRPAVHSNRPLGASAPVLHPLHPVSAPRHGPPVVSAALRRPAEPLCLHRAAAAELPRVAQDVGRGVHPPVPAGPAAPRSARAAVMMGLAGPMPTFSSPQRLSPTPGTVGISPSSSAAPRTPLRPGPPAAAQSSPVTPGQPHPPGAPSAAGPAAQPLAAPPRGPAAAAAILTRAHLVPSAPSLPAIGSILRPSTARLEDLLAEGYVPCGVTTYLGVYREDELRALERRACERESIVRTLISAAVPF